MYRHANIDLFLTTAEQGRGLGREAIALVVGHLFGERGHHRITIDPAAANQRAIRCYGAVGFRPVGVMRRYERGADGSFHDGLLMELRAPTISERRPATRQRSSGSSTAPARSDACSRPRLPSPGTWRSPKPGRSAAIGVGLRPRQQHHRRVAVDARQATRTAARPARPGRIPCAPGRRRTAAMPARSAITSPDRPRREPSARAARPAGSGAPAAAALSTRAVGDRAHRDVDHGRRVAVRQRQAERVGAEQRRAALGVHDAGASRCAVTSAHQPGAARPLGEVAEPAGGKAAGHHHQPRAGAAGRPARRSSASASAR